MAFTLRPSVYVQLAPERICIRNVTTGKTMTDTPHIALSHKGRVVVVAVGSDALIAAQTPGITVHNPLGHPRSLVSDFTLAEQVLKYFLANVVERSLFGLPPWVLMHPVDEQEGGLTQVEIRALRELALGAGAAKADVWHGRVLTDREVQERDFPKDGQLLN